MSIPSSAGGAGGQQQQQHQHQSTSFSYHENNGPRAKCDQVIFEAIAKAAEIVVGSRCWIDSGNPFGAGGGSNGSSNNSSRFNLLVPEIQGVRYVFYCYERTVSFLLILNCGKLITIPYTHLLLILLHAIYKVQSYNVGNVPYMYHYD